MPNLEINGITLHYQVHGQGAPVLLLHGLGSSLKDWEFQIDTLKQQFKVITCDLRGHGESSKPRTGYSMQRFADDVACLLRELKVQPAHIVGLSMGGMVGLELSLSHRECVKTLTLVNCLPQVIVRPITKVKRWFILNILGMKALATCLAEPLLPGPGLAELRQTVIERWQTNDRNAYSASTYAILKWSAMDRLDQITQPVTVMASQYDYWPLQLKKRVFSAIPCVEFVEIPDAHHLASLEYPDEFNQLLMDVLRKNM